MSTPGSQATQRASGDASRRAKANKDNADREEEPSLSDPLTFGIFE